MPASRSTKDVLEAVRASPGQRVKLAVVDIDGILRGKYVHKDKFFSAADGGFGFCDVVYGWDCHDQCYDNTTSTGWHKGYPDALARIDLATHRNVPWDDGVDFFLAVDLHGDLLGCFEVPPRRLDALAHELLELWRAFALHRLQGGDCVGVGDDLLGHVAHVEVPPLLLAEHFLGHLEHPLRRVRADLQHRRVGFLRAARRNAAFGSHLGRGPLLHAGPGRQRKRVHTQRGSREARDCLTSAELTQAGAIDNMSMRRAHLQKKKGRLSLRMPA